MVNDILEHCSQKDQKWQYALRPLGWSQHAFMHFFLLLWFYSSFILIDCLSDMQSLFIVWEYLSIFCFLTKPLESDMENIKPKVKMSHNAKYRCL